MPEANEEKNIRGKAFWSGNVTFGLVSIPVLLFAGNRPSKVSLRMLAPDGTPLKRRYFCPQDGQMLEPEDIVRGFETESGQYVQVTDEELEALEPRKSREIDLRRFVPADQIDPAAFERSYFLAPSGDTLKAYILLAEAMERTRRAGIATVVMRGREYLIALTAERGVLKAETLRFAEELRAPEPVEAGRDGELPEVKRLTERIRAAREAVLNAKIMENRTQEKMLALVRTKLESGRDVVSAEKAQPEDSELEPEEGGQVIDLMAVLKQTMGLTAEAEVTPQPRQKTQNTPSRIRGARRPKAPTGG